MTKKKTNKPDKKESPEEKAKVGRPTKFNDVVSEKIISLAEEGKTNLQIAEIIGVHERTIENWIGKKQELKWSVKEAKQIADGIVEASLFSKAVGFQHKAQKIFCSKDGLVTKVDYVEQHAPDTTAAIFWLKNRQPDRWREKTEVKHTGHLDMTEDQLDERIEELIKEAKKGSK